MRLALLLPLLVGCVEDRATLEVPVRVGQSEAAVVLEGGVSLELGTAELTLADLRFEEPEHATARPRSFSLVSTAHAHPGHGGVGDIAGELAGAWTVDLLAGDEALGAATCFEGAYATARLDLLPDPPVRLEGVATVDGMERPFAFTLAPDDEVAGLGFDATLDAAAPPAGIALDVDLAHVLSEVDWSTPDEDGDGVLTVSDGSLENSVRFGVISTATYQLSVED